MSRTFLIFISLAFLFSACSSPEKRAQKLFDQGKFEEVRDNFPGLQITKQAIDSIAARVRTGQPQEVLMNTGIEDWRNTYGDRAHAADSLYAQGLWDSVLSNYPGTVPANLIRNVRAQDLYRNAKFDELIQKFPNTPAGMNARNEAAAVEWTKISKLRGQKRVAAIEEFLKNPCFAGTESALKAQQELNKLSK